MSNLILPRPSWHSGFARSAAESANPGLWDGLVGAWVPALGVTGGTLHDVSGHGNDGTLENMTLSTDWEHDSLGGSLLFDNGTTQIVGTGKSYSLGGYCTISILYKPTSALVGYQFLTGQRDTYATYDWQLFNSTDFYNLGFWTKSGQLVSNVTLTNGVYYYIAAQQTGSVLKLYLDAEEIGSQTGVGAMPVGTDEFTIGKIRQSDATLHSAGGNIAVVLLHKRVLSILEIRQIYQDPLAPFRLAPLPVYVPVSGGGTTVDATLGTLEIAGVDVSVTASTLIEATVGTLTVAGVNAAVTADTLIEATLGTLTVAGINATVTANTLVNATVGTLEISGIDASVSTGTTVDATLGTLEVAGVDATVTAATLVNATVGTLEVAGIDASITAGSNPVTSESLLSLLNLSMPWYTTLPLPDGSIGQGDRQHLLHLYSGILVAGGGTLVDATVGTLEVAGIDATVTAGTLVNATVGTLEIAGVNAAVTAAVTINATLGTLEIAGVDATVTVGSAINATVGTLEVAGIDATVTADTLIEATMGTLVLAAINASVISATRINATVGTLEVAGIDATVSSGGANWIGLDAVAVFQPGAAASEVFAPGADAYEVRQ